MVGLLNVYEVSVGNNKKFYMVCYEAKHKQIIDSSSIKSTFLICNQIFTLIMSLPALIFTFVSKVTLSINLNKVHPTMFEQPLTGNKLYSRTEITK